MIVGRELRLARQLAGQHSAGQRHARQNADLLARRLREEQIRRTLPEAVEDDLHRLHVGILDRLERLLHALHADAVVANLAGLHQPVERAEDLGPVIDIGGRAMQLHQVEAIGGEIAQAVLDEAGEVALRCSRRQCAARAGGRPWWPRRSLPSARASTARSAARCGPCRRRRRCR